MSTLHKIYRRRLYDQIDADALEWEGPTYACKASPKYAKAEGPVRLELRVLDRSDMRAQHGYLECCVEDPNGRLSKATREQEDEVILSFPQDFDVSGALDAGRYDVTWVVVQELRMLADDRIRRDRFEVEADWFGILP